MIQKGLRATVGCTFLIDKIHDEDGLVVKLQKIQGERYATTIKLIADGQPYDFKFSDADWSPGLNCGYLDQDNDQLVTLDQSVSSGCDTTDQNFKFIPSETGVYEFSIDFSDPAIPTVVINKASESS